MIPYGRQNISQQDIDAVIEVLKSDFLTQGPVVPAFENAVASYCGAKYSVATNSATSALHVACLALGLGEGDYLWTSPITFVASANCAFYCGAKIDFVDIDPKTYNISVDALEEKLEIASKNGSLPKVVMPVHLCGQSCDMEKINQLARKYGFHVIEDASHAIGGKYQGKPIGCCQYSDICVFSFHPVKIITTGEGGMALSNNAELADKMALLRSHGVTRDPGKMTKESDGAWYYQQIDLGFNYRMTDIHASLGKSQLNRLDEFVFKRNQLADSYNSLLEGLPLKLPWVHSDCYSSYHLYVIRLKLDQINRTHREVFDFLRDNGIGVNVHYIPVFEQPYFINKISSENHFPEAISYYEEAISLPLFPALTALEQSSITETLSAAIA